jgi:hypothetical protein
VPFCEFSCVRLAAEELERAFCLFITFNRPAQMNPLIIEFIKIIRWNVELLPFHIREYPRNRFSYINVEF